MKTSELRALTVDELKNKENDLRKELFNLRFQKAYAYSCCKKGYSKDFNNNNREN